MSEDLVTQHHHRLSHAERKIDELNNEIHELKTKNSQLALRTAELEAALLRLDEVKQEKPYTGGDGWWSLKQSG